MRLILLIPFLLAALPFYTKAQTPVPRCFKAYNEAGMEVTIFCVGELITFKDCSVFQGRPGVEPDKEYYDYDKRDGLDFTSSAATEKRFRYSQPGTYTVTQYARDVNGIDAAFERTFEVKAIPAPAFVVRTCANRSVQVNITDNNYHLYDIDYGDGTIRQNITTGLQPPYTYTGASGTTFTLTVRGKYEGASCSNTSTQVVELLPAPTAPVISRLEVIREETAGELSLSLQGLQPGYRYVVERLAPAASGYTVIDTTQLITQTTLQNYRLAGVNTSEAARYRLRPVDRCGTQIGVISAPVSSLTLGVQAGNEQAILTWRGNNSEVNRYEIFRNNMLLQSTDRNTGSYTDRNLICGQNYCYQVAGIAHGGLSTSVSVQRCVQINSSAPPPVGYLYTSYDPNNQVQLLFAVPQGHEATQIRYQRSMDGEPYATLATTTQPELTDKLPSPAGVCYRATYTNPCNRESGLSNTSCPVYLIVLPQDNAPVLTLGWTGYVGFPDGVSRYTVQVLDQNNQIMASYPVSGNTYVDRNLSDEVQELRYRIMVTSGNGRAVSFSNTEVVKQPLQVHIPTAFTPNNDGLNDVLEVKGRFIREYTIKIYNHLGHMVFTSNDRSVSWDGTFQGKPQPAGAYAYEVNIITTSGEAKRRTGTVTLLR